MIDTRYPLLAMKDRWETMFMIKLNKKDIASVSVISFFIIFAYLCRLVTKFDGPFSEVLSIIRAAIYIGLFSIWGISVRRRIIQTQVRRYLVAISILMIFWMVVRTLKFSYAVRPEHLRYLWYLYYLAQLFIPLFLLLVTFSLGKPENFQLPKWTILLYIPSAVFFVLVVTNDLHQLIFGFPNQPWSDHTNTYAPLFYLLSSWEYFCGIAALVVMWTKCRIMQSRKRIILPIILILILFAYQIFYLSRAQWLRFLAGDATVVSLLCFTGILESCIRTGLIQSNTRYKELFYASTLNAVIADHDYNIILSSENANNFGADIMKITEAAPAVYCGKRISSAPIHGGRFLWQDDISELLSVLAQLEESKAALKASNLVLQENYRAMRKMHKLSERSRLYDMVHKKNEESYKCLNRLFEQFKKERNEGEKYNLFGKILVLGAYIKRRSNLIFMAEQNETLPLEELTFCFRETTEILQLNNIEFGFSVMHYEKIAAENVIKVYDFFENILETVFDVISALYLTVRSKNDRIITDIALEFVSNGSAQRIQEVQAEQNEDGTYHITFQITKEGADG